MYGTSVTYQFVYNDGPVLSSKVYSPPVESTSCILVFWNRRYLHQVLLFKAWWRHQMETFSALLAFCVGNKPVTGEFPAERPVTQSFGVFFDLRLNKRLSKQSWGWYFRRHRAHYDVTVICLATKWAIAVSPISVRHQRLLIYKAQGYIEYYLKSISLEWRHNGCAGVSNHQLHNCFLSRLFRQRSKKTSKLAPLDFVR